MGGHHYPKQRQTTSMTYPGIESRLHSVVGGRADYYANRVSFIKPRDRMVR